MPRLLSVCDLTSHIVKHALLLVCSSGLRRTPSAHSQTNWNHQVTVINAVRKRSKIYATFQRAHYVEDTFPESDECWTFGD